MREIKFRGKDKGGEWHYGNLLQRYDRLYIIPFDGNYTLRVASRGMQVVTTFRNVNEVIPETVGQFTRLKDKNEEDIYEGDILKYNHQSFEPPSKRVSLTEVYYWDDGFWGDNKRLKDEIMSLDKKRVIFEIIGNVHDNLELLEK